MSSLYQYYFLDWAGMILSLLSAYLLGNRQRLGFLLFAFSNLIFIFLGLTWMESVGMAVGNVAFMIINIRGYVHWTKNVEPEASVTPA
ncbi:nicotinamide mononucleotide transporter [Microbulbifer sp. CAU 1566]|uniref:nicotinamide mononucleotide transporter n=1 Tax=Microbulbifer sp. CAU 1566 TaxID=2933269 RepID=UPI0020042818|nr:nicotinamide mononucleotide transporter [Microbulbifer sp. CAU 1566]MCK7598807.1 nicotinamide mononucleotide transporter [Microbulbifer sp. CAU 1566]